MLNTPAGNGQTLKTKHMLKKCLFIIFLGIFSAVLSAQSEITYEIQLLTSEQIAEVTLEQKSFGDWIQYVKSEIETHLSADTGNKEVLFLITLHRDRDATIEIGARPILDPASIETLSANIAKKPSPKTKITDYSFLILAFVNEGCNEDIDFYPDITHPQDREFAKFQELDLKGKKEALQQWVEDEVLPIVAYYETTVDTVFAGVLSVGKIVEEKKYLDTETEVLTEKNPDYWRATMEMNIGNQIIPFTKICMHIVNDEFGKSNTWLSAIRLFSAEKTLPVVFYDEMVSKMRMLNEELTHEIEKGIALHDEGKYREAMDHYENLLKIFPKSAWIHYELYYSKTARMKDIHEIEAEWKKSKKVIYDHDPMYPLDVSAKSGKEGYLLFRRQEINNLFQSEENYRADFIRYADIALDLENYGFAAELYWIIFSHLSEENYEGRNMLAHYLYCLDKLGDKESIKNFEGDFIAEFENIDKERQKLMEENAIYNSFEKKE